MKVRTQKRKERIRRTQRRIRGGAISATLIRQTLPEYFPTFSKEQIKFRRGTNGIDYTISITCQERAHFTDQDRTMYVSIDKKTMVLEMLTRCNQIRGKALLDTWINFARAIGIRTVELVDNSMIYVPDSEYGNHHCSLSLPTLSILSSGQSWYERMGFRSRRSDEYRAHNETVRAMPFPTFIEAILERFHTLVSMEQDMINMSQFTTANAYPSSDAYLQGFYEAFPEMSSMETVGEIFEQIMKTYLRGNASPMKQCDDIRLRFLQDMIKLAETSLYTEPLVKYDALLSLSLVDK